MSDELQADGQAIAGKAAGQRHRTEVEQVDGNGVAQAQAIDGEVDAIPVYFFEYGGGERCGRGDEEIDIVEVRAGFAAEQIAFDKLLRVVYGRNVTPVEDALRDDGVELI